MQYEVGTVMNYIGYHLQVVEKINERNGVFRIVSNMGRVDHDKSKFNLSISSSFKPVVNVNTLTLAERLRLMEEMKCN